MGVQNHRRPSAGMERAQELPLRSESEGRELLFSWQWFRAWVGLVPAGCTRDGAPRNVVPPDTRPLFPGHEDRRGERRERGVEDRDPRADRYFRSDPSIVWPCIAAIRSGTTRQVECQ